MLQAVTPPDVYGAEVAISDVLKLLCGTCESFSG